MAHVTKACSLLFSNLFTLLKYAFLIDLLPVSLILSSSYHIQLGRKISDDFPSTRHQCLGKVCDFLRPVHLVLLRDDLFKLWLYSLTCCLRMR